MMFLVTALLVLASAQESNSGLVESCAAGHFEGRRCINHKNKEDCLSYYNKNAGGPNTPLEDKICGWSINEDKFGGEGKSNCASAPWVVGKGKQTVSDFGACNKEYGGTSSDGTMPPTMPPTCGDCEEFHGDKSGCKKADPARYCVDACVWNKNNNKCTGVNCSDLNGKSNMLKCSKKMRKAFGLTCYFNVNDNTCNATNPMVSCDTYNGLKSRNDRKKGCKKIGKHDNNCTFSSATKKCHVEGAPLPCADIKSMGACRANGCVYMKENSTCLEL